ncbi:MAG: hypothetical protein L6Q78_04325 [Bacteroidia bacterium]|nr:hypothetical protein [Bacteroidia bacterium]
MKSNWILFAVLFFLACSNEQSTMHDPYSYKEFGGSEPVTEQANSSNGFSGNWYRNKPFENASLEIFDENPDGFRFKLVSEYGANTTQLEGKAMIDEQGNGFYSGSEFGLCELRFIRKPEFIEVAYIHRDCGTAMGVVFNGKFKAQAPSQDTRSLKQLGLVQTKEQEEQMKTLLGNSIKLLRETAHQVAEIGTDSETGARILKVGVAGMYDQMQARVLLKNEEIWVACMDAESNQILYFTNVEEWKQRAPESIRTFAAEYPELTHTGF